MQTEANLLFVSYHAFFKGTSGVQQLPAWKVVVGTEINHQLTSQHMRSHSCGIRTSCTQQRCQSPFLHPQDKSLESFPNLVLKGGKTRLRAGFSLNWKKL